jgi:DeoR/GlpR family transcriptional regulator of sugar metabolism
MAQASQTLVVADHSKFGIQAPVRVCRFDQVDVLVTDKAPPDALRCCLEDAGTELLIAD